MNEQFAIAAAAAATVAAGYCYIQICREVHHWDDPEVAENKGVDNLVSSDKMLWTAPLGDGTKSKGETTSPALPAPPLPGRPFYVVTLRLPKVVYLTINRTWTSDINRAARFEFLTVAYGWAVDCGYGLEDVSVEYHAKLTM